MKPLPETIKVMKQPVAADGQIGIYEFICDSKRDVESLPTDGSVRPGSRALVLDPVSVFVLSASRGWVDLTNGCSNNTP